MRGGKGGVIFYGTSHLPAFLFQVVWVCVMAKGFGEKICVSFWHFFFPDHRVLGVLLSGGGDDGCGFRAIVFVNW